MSKTLRHLVLALLIGIAAPPVDADGMPVERFARLALDCVHQEYPNQVKHAMAGDADLAPPRELTPVFYGCFDWHSAVHGHWMLVRLLRLAPDAAFAADAEAALERSFQPGRVAAEVRYLDHPQRDAFERPYGIAWLFQLVAELHEWDDPRAARWRETLRPLETAYAAKTYAWLGKLAYPIRTGEHAQTAFAFGLFLDWARATGQDAFAERVATLARAFHAADRECPLDYEPGGQDFLSNCLAEADLMRRVLAPDEFAQWLRHFLPRLSPAAGPAWLPLATVTDRADGKLAHLDGLHLSRAWMLAGIAAGLPPADPRRGVLMEAAVRQGRAGLAAVTGEHYEGGHWLGSFATYLATRRGGGLAWPAEVAVAPAAGPAERRVAEALERIRRYDGMVSAIIAVNEDALAEARAIDRAGAPAGPLAGVPLVVKDNIEMREPIATTAGSLALAGNITRRDAGVMERVRAAGLVPVAKANLSEWANFRSSRSSSGWSAIGGQTRNPYALDRSPCGSSSGSAAAVAAGMAPLAIGTETNGSIICPAAINGLVGIKPTVGLVSRRGIVPISHSQDTAGPIATGVADAAHLLAAMVGPDPADPATAAVDWSLPRDYPAHLDRGGLVGKRVGVARSQVGFHSDVDAVFERALGELAAAGAILVEDVDLGDYPEGFWRDSFDVLLHEFKHGIDAYLAELPATLPVRTLADLVAFNEANAAAEMPHFAQETFEQAQAKGGLDDPAYLEALARVRAFTRDALDGALARHELDLLVMPSYGPAWTIDLVNGDHFVGGNSSFAAIAGYPHVTVPMGRVQGLPVGLSFVGAAFAEETLIEAAYAYEQATRHAAPPAGFGGWRPAVDAPEAP